MTTLIEQIQAADQEMLYWSSRMNEETPYTEEWFAAQHSRWLMGSLKTDLERQLASTPARPDSGDESNGGGE